MRPDSIHVTREGHGRGEIAVADRAHKIEAVALPAAFVATESRFNRQVAGRVRCAVVLATRAEETRPVRPKSQGGAQGGAVGVYGIAKRLKVNSASRCGHSTPTGSGRGDGGGNGVRCGGGGGCHGGYSPTAVMRNRSSAVRSSSVANRHTRGPIRRNGISRFVCQAPKVRMEIPQNFAASALRMNLDASARRACSVSDLFMRRPS
jgi:hypothetical protein